MNIFQIYFYLLRPLQGSNQAVSNIFQQKSIFYFADYQ